MNNIHLQFIIDCYMLICYINCQCCSTDIILISKHQIENRDFWIDKIYRLSNNFLDDAESIEQEIAQEIRDNGIDYIIGHLRLCDVIPEKYGHDTTKEKLYSKYTDIVIH